MPPFPPISEYADSQTSIWASCAAEPPCGHQAWLELGAIIARYGDMPLDRLKRRLRCRCGARGEIRLVASGRPSR